VNSGRVSSPLKTGGELRKGKHPTKNRGWTQVKPQSKYTGELKNLQLPPLSINCYFENCTILYNHFKNQNLCVEYTPSKNLFILILLVLFKIKFFNSPVYLLCGLMVKRRNLSKVNLLWTSFCVQNRQLFNLYRP
jgi:hypothetical protein